ncbi:MAG: iron ABC transporter permease [Alistipes sp.]|nr:iron ABC transporter permease [Alistipes sp.]
MQTSKAHITHIVLFAILAVALGALAICGLLTGTTELPLGDVWDALIGRTTDVGTQTIVLKMRMPKVLVAIAAGAALSASGLQMQTLFRNPLAGPYVLGINSGASLGVALFTLAMPMLGVGTASWFMSFGITGMAWIGSAAILMLVMWLSRKIKNINTILIIGMMLGSAISAIVGILQYMGTEESLKAFIVWTMGSLGTVTTEQLYILIPVVIVGMMLAIVAIKPLDVLLLGESYARTMGINIKLTRLVIFLSTTLLAGTITAFCGPIGFIGLAMPHLARMTFRTASHRVLMPATMLWGAVSMLLCSLMCDIVARSGVMLPVNTITSLLGVPIIIYVVIRNRNRQ